MSTQVKGVTEIAQQIHEVNKLASKVGQELKRNLEDVKEALEIADEVSTSLRNSGAELRGVLGMTNRPPQEEDKHEGSA